jgi:Uma2 family endonuclease
MVALWGGLGYGGQMSAAIITEGQYLLQERHGEQRHEFVDGRMVAMAGDSLRHNQIIFQIRLALAQAVAEKQCFIATESVRVMTKQGRYRYPDVVIAYGEQPDEYSLVRPCLLVEVQSDSTAEVDNGAKLEEYTNLPSLERYAIVAQHSKQVVVYKRQGNLWLFDVLLDSGSFDVPCVGATLTLEQIYSGIEL